MHPLLGRLIVGLVLSLISFISYSSQIFIIWPWYGREVSVELLTLLVPFNVLVGMLFWNYFLCVVTDPGQVPATWKPDLYADGYEVKKVTGGPRHCRICEKYKPPRAHHCRQCDRCILRMDHHCPWVNNCVGHSNYGHFIRFLFYVDLACSYHVAMVTRRVFDAIGQQYWDEPSSLEFIFIILNYVTCIPVLLSVGAFSIYHIYSMLGNTTTIEGWEKDKVATMVRRGKIRQIKFPYNLGMRRNIESVLGENPLLWCWPTATPGTGLKYQLADGDDSQSVWPPRDPATITSDGCEKEMTVQSSPWTYENGSLNPNLQPSNAQLRRQVTSSKRQNIGVGFASLPPYHPDYREGGDGAYELLDENDSSEYDGRSHLVRRGSEGYEVRPVDREDMLKRYLEDLGEDPSRYQRYVPEPDSGDDDDIPLSQTVEH